MSAEVVVYGEALVDLIPDGEGNYQPRPGGSPFNVAVALARLGVDVAFLAPFSEDAFGCKLVELLEDEGVEILVTRRSRRPTSIAIVEDSDAGPRYSLYRTGVADTDISLNQVLSVLPENFDVFHTGSLALTPEQASLTRGLLNEVKRRGIPVSIDINVRAAATDDIEAYRSVLLEFGAMTNLLKASDEDLASLGHDIDSAAVFQSEMDCELFAFTSGPEGAGALSESISVTCNAFNVETIVDTVGAGDVFQAGLIAGLLRAAPEFPVQHDQKVLLSILERACMAAAINVGRVGCDPPTYEEIETYMDQAPYQPSQCPIKG